MSFDDQIARWGVPPEPIKLKAGMVAFLNERVGKLHPSPQAGRTKVEVPDSRISEGVLSEFQSALSAESVTTDADARLAHSGGFSYLDIVARRGVEPKVADAVIFGEIDRQRPEPDDVRAISLHHLERIDCIP